MKKHNETIAEQNHRLKPLAIESSKKFNHQSFVYIGRGVVKKVEL
jgi:hypothetical protein